MTEFVVKTPISFPSGEIVAIGISEEDFLRDFMDSHHEWVDGVVIRMSPIAIEHNNLLKFLIKLFDAYFGINPIGQTLVQPFVMRLENSLREPDMQVVLADNPATLTRTRLLGAADICIEIVSEESVARDYGDKLKEYQRAGVREYWIIDPLLQNTHFHRLQDDQRYALISPEEGIYHTPILPRFALTVATLWQDPLPDYFQIGDWVKQMFAEND